MIKISVRKIGSNRRWHRAWVGFNCTVQAVIDECRTRGLEYKISLA
ncbi:MAG TPA: hypothetical protein VG934_01750 [Candidatus Paceibacterota bacterium]|nr:hypothetical protein [Candidatus Paceibacterota bacterium]